MSREMSKDKQRWARQEGHKCWAYRSVFLCLRNDAKIYHMVKAYIAESPNLDVAAKLIHARLRLGPTHECYWGAKTPCGANYSDSSIREAIRNFYNP